MNNASHKVLIPAHLYARALTDFLTLIRIRTNQHKSNRPAASHSKQNEQSEENTIFFCRTVVAVQKNNAHLQKWGKKKHISTIMLIFHG